MNETFWARVREAFEAAAELPADQRATVVAAMSAGDPAVLRAATELLEADAGDFLMTPASLPDDFDAMATRIPPGTLIGGYRVVRLVGQGGMGEVYEGVRATGDFYKRAAIKLLRAGLTGSAAIARFERERRILAGLEHPNIAALLDGGLTGDGAPYLIMEFVEGDRITTWCDSRKLGLGDRLDLFCQASDAVSYAHRHLVVHRDLKPGNILVTHEGVVKLLDFGIAKVLADGSGDAETETRPEMRALTREYAAPEHLTDGPITTGADVYALGLLLFELLAGRRPFQGRDLGFVEFVRLVTTHEPPLPSSVRAEDGRGVGARERARVRGDLDAIILRALRPNPAERYGTVDELVADLRRFEEGRPVSAMRGRRIYRLRKFVRRNRGALLGAGAFGAALTAGIVATSAQARRADVQRNRAEATNLFLTEMLQAVDPTAQGRDVPMAEVLDSAARRIDRDRPREPEVEASLRSAIGASYVALGKYDAAEPHLRRALALRLRRPDDLLPLVNAIGAMAGLYDSRGEYARADTMYRRALAMLPASRDTAIARRANDLTNQLARMQSQQGHYPVAIGLLRQALARQIDLYGPVSDPVARTTGDLGLTLLQSGDPVHADSEFEAAIRIIKSVTPRDRMMEGADLGRLATALDFEGESGRADSAYRGSLEILDSVMGRDHPEVTWIRYNYAGSLLDWGAARRSLAEADTVLALRGRTLPETHPILASVLMVKGQALGKLGEHDSAAAVMREGLALRQKYLAPGHWLIGSAESILGSELWDGGRTDEAVALLLDGCKVMTRALGPDHPKTRDAVARLARTGRAKGCG